MSLTPLTKAALIYAPFLGAYWVSVLVLYVRLKRNPSWRPKQVDAFERFIQRKLSTSNWVRLHLAAAVIGTLAAILVVPFWASLMTR